jgi:hypothetical protein
MTNKKACRRRTCSIDAGNIEGRVGALPEDQEIVELFDDRNAAGPMHDVSPQTF